MRKLFVIPFLLIFLSGCMDYSINLPNGYSIVRSNVDDVTIANKNLVVVISPKIIGYDIREDLVVGLVSTEGLPSEIIQESKPGYFVIDTKSDKINQGLSEEVWLHLLSSHGISDRPKLKHPTWFRSIGL